MRLQFTNRGTGFYANLAAGAIGLICTLLYLIYSLSVGHFAAVVFVMLLLGTIAAAVAMVFDWKFLAIFPVLFYSLAFGLYVNDRVVMFEEMINNITGMTERGAILPIVIIVFVLCLLSIVGGIVAAFTDKDKIRA